MVNVDKIKELASQKGITLSFLCRSIKQGTWYFHDVKKGKTTMSSENLLIIADILDTTTDYLTDKTDKKEKPTVKYDELDDKFIELFRKLSPLQKDFLLSSMQGLSEKQDD